MDLGVATSDASWVLTAYLLAAAVLTPILGRLGDMVGKRRALQGATGAAMPLSIDIVRDELPKESAHPRAVRRRPA